MSGPSGERCSACYYFDATPGIVGPKVADGYGVCFCSRKSLLKQAVSWCGEFKSAPSEQHSLPPKPKEPSDVLFTSFREPHEDAITKTEERHGDEPV